MSNKKTVILYDGKVEITFHPNSHRYYVSINGGKKFIPNSSSRVSGIIDKSTPLIIWATRLVKDYLTQYVGRVLPSHELEKAINLHDIAKTEAADIGSQVHKYCEDTVNAVINGDPDPIAPTLDNVRTGATAFLDWIANNNVKFIGSEQIVYSLKHNHIGIYDLKAEVNGELCVIDFKTSNKVYMEHKMQLASYAKAVEEESGEKVQKAIILHLCKNTGDFKEHIMNREDIDYYYKGFLIANDLTYFVKQESKR